MAGRGSLAGTMPYGDANAIVMDMAGEVLTVVEDTPVLAGVCGTDPFRQMDVFLREVEAIGFSGVQNFPTVGLIDGLYRQNLEETGMGYGEEVEMIRTAHEMGLLTTPYAFNPEEGEQMAAAGADIVVAHAGLTTKGAIGATTALTLEESVGFVQAICDAARGRIRGGDCAVPRGADFRAGGRRVRVAKHDGASMASTARRAWSGCRSRWPLPST